ncbi:unnamed protein product [Haemonchus placei]|uniref:G_PROTEIN_RECEP_F1_2 domain-containing protein n=1 Tax=Haemonchus placei TaxID=6290 RepID=A0A0N4WJY4_HAEPC|nr:unnamed protein product [Haemonchus placei]
MENDYVTIERISLQQGFSSILLLNIIELFLLLGAFLLNILFLCVLLRYSVFHIHLRIICLHITSAVTLVTVYSLIRTLVSLYQIFGNPLVTEPDDLSTCLFVDVVPTCFCVLFIVFPLIVVIERSIATEKVRGYETFHFPSGMMRLCMIFWMPAMVWLISGGFSLSTQSSVLSCELRRIREQTPLQRSVWYTLSHRFQLRENSRTCSFLVSLHGLICLCFLAFTLVDHANADVSNTNDMYTLLFKRELSYVISPLFTILFALNFLCRLDIVYDKAKKFVRAIYGYEEGCKQKPQTDLFFRPHPPQQPPPPPPPPKKRLSVVIAIARIKERHNV